MDTVEKIFFLGKVPMFSNMTQDDLRLISQLAEEHTFKEDEMIMKEKEYEEEFNLYIIISGSIKMSKISQTPDGIEKESKFRMLSETDFFGHIEVFAQESKPASATYWTETETRVLRINGKKLTNLLLRYPRITIEICKVFSRRIREASRELAGAA